MMMTHLCDEIEDGIGEDVEGRASRDDERAPPPVIILQYNQEHQLYLTLKTSFGEMQCKLTSPQSWK